MCGAGRAYRDKDNKFCNVKGFKSSLVAYYRWNTKQKGHISVKDTSYTIQELAFVSMEVSIDHAACPPYKVFVLLVIHKVTLTAFVL